MTLPQKLYFYFKVFIITLIIVSMFVLLVVLAINLGIQLYAQEKIYEKEDAPKANVAIVLGARVLPNKNLSDILKDRALTAAALWESEKVEKILVSGDNSSQYYNEVVPVKNFLMKKGIPEEVIYLDYAGFDTYDTAYRAKNIFLVQDALIVTQEFHLPRAIYLCKKVGIKCSGVIADTQTYIKADYFAQREKLANVKAFLNVLFNSDPKFMGDVIDINAED